MKKKRLYTLGGLILCMLLLLCGRLMQIQLFQTEDFSKYGVNLLEGSVNQRVQQLVIDEGRGQFIDRNGQPLTFEEKKVLVLFPFLKQEEDILGQVADILDLSPTTLKNAVVQAKEPFILEGYNGQPLELSDREMTRISNLKVPGLMAVEKIYGKDKPSAAHLLGLIKENKEEFERRYDSLPKNSKPLLGITGLQKQFDELLRPDGEAKLVYHVDGIGEPLFGLDVKYTAPANPFYPIRVKTTIDTQLQEALEETANEQDLYKGAAVLLDIETNELLAAVSRPDIDVSNPYKNEGMQNLALTPLIPGSVFKTVTAAAALEEQLPELDRIFNCNETLYGTADKRELGNLSFEESFAQSCNRTFGDLAKVLQENHSNSLEIYAEKLGLTGEIGWRGSFFHEEEFVPLDIGEGMVFTDSDKRKDKNISAQTGIGQHDVKVSPLAVANMMATIARGGEKKLVKGVQAVQYKNGTTMFEFEDVPADGESISSVTASRLQKLLRSVVQSKEGTGAALQAAPYPIAGKTGTAETGKFIGDKQLYNKWFAGYFPFDQPKYALVVVRTEAFEQGGGVQSFYLEAVNKIYRISGENP